MKSCRLVLLLPLHHAHALTLLYWQLLGAGRVHNSSPKPIALSSFEVVQHKVIIPSCCPVLQDYIESENARLEREQQFWAKEIVVKIEYKFCPNLTIIDTPGESS